MAGAPWGCRNGCRRIGPGFPQRTIARIESGRSSPRGDTPDRLSCVCGVGLDLGPWPLKEASRRLYRSGGAAHRMSLASDSSNSRAARPDVWVIVPAKNEAPVIAETLRGLLCLGLHVVVVDDGSDDDTADVAPRA